MLGWILALLGTIAILGSMLFGGHTPRAGGYVGNSPNVTCRASAQYVQHQLEELATSRGDPQPEGTRALARELARDLDPCVPQRPSTVGGTRVPRGLRCYEDEVIGFTGVDTLDCIHIDTLR